MPTTTGFSINTDDNKLALLPNLVVALILAAIVAGAFVGAFIMWPQAGGALQAVVHDSNGSEHVVDLETDQRLVVETDLGRNVIEVEDGSVRIVEADCPNGDCLHQHAISSPGQQLICLPHRLWVEIIPAGGERGQMDVNAVADDAPSDVDLIAR